MISRVRLAKMEDSYGVVEGQFDDAVDAGPCRCDTVDVNMYESNETFVMLFLSVFTPGKLKSLLDRGGNRTSDLWFASPILYQLNYELKSVRVGRFLPASLTCSVKGGG